METNAIMWTDLEDVYDPGYFAVKDCRLYREGKPGDANEFFSGRRWVYVGQDFAARKITELYDRVNKGSLPCGHPVSCDGLAGPDRDEPGCGWCADLKDLSMLTDHLSRTYEHFSGGRVSKPNTLPEEVFHIADEISETERIAESQINEKGQSNMGRRNSTDASGFQVNVQTVTPKMSPWLPVTSLSGRTVFIPLPIRLLEQIPDSEGGGTIVHGACGDKVGTKESIIQILEWLNGYPLGPGVSVWSVAE